MAFLIFVRSFRINAFVWQEREDISKNEEFAPQSENNPQYVKSRSSADCEQSETFIFSNLKQSEAYVFKTLPISGQEQAV